MKAFRLALVPLFVALCAAPAAHVAIDLLGDVLLPHDTYDDVAHGSRAFVACGALAFAFVFAVCGLRALVRAARGSERAFCTTLAAALPRRPAAFFASVVVVTPAILVAMEALDAKLATRSVDDFGDLLGGSLALGLSVAFVAACAVAGAAWAALRRLARASDSLVRIVASFIRRSAGNARTVAYAERGLRRVARRRRGSVLRRAGRAPPYPSAAT